MKCMRQVSVVAVISGLCLNAVPVFAQAGSSVAEAVPFTVRLASLLPMVVLLMLIFYIFVLRPQNEQQKRQSELLAGLKRGDQVVTTGGLIGKVLEVQSEYVMLDSGGGKLKVEREHVRRRYEPAQTKAGK